MLNTAALFKSDEDQGEFLRFAQRSTSEIFIMLHVDNQHSVCPTYFAERNSQAFKRFFYKDTGLFFLFFLEVLYSSELNGTGLRGNDKNLQRS